MYLIVKENKTKNIKIQEDNNMKIKRNIAIGLGAIMIAGISIVGVSQISANAQNKAATNTTTQQ